MKALSMRISAGVIALAGLMYMLACSQPSGNNTQNQNIAANGNQNRSIAANSNETARDLDPCTIHPDPAAVAADILQRLKDEINSSEAADGLKPDPTGTRGTFTVDVQQAKDSNGKNRNYFEAYVKGEIRGDDHLKILSDILNNFQNENDCLRVVYFVEDLNAPNTPAGFRWSSCQYPKHVCPNGECCEIEPIESPGVTPTPTPTPTPSPSAGANTNASEIGNTNK